MAKRSTILPKGPLFCQKGPHFVQKNPPVKVSGYWLGYTYIMDPLMLEMAQKVVKLALQGRMS